MYIDERFELADSQNLTATGNSTDHVDLGSDRDIGPGRQLWAVVVVDAIDGTSADETYSLALQTDDNSGFSSATDIATLAIPRTTPAGSQFVVGFPLTNERYLRARLTLGGTTPSITYSAFVTDQEPRAWQPYPDAVS